MQHFGYLNIVHNAILKQESADVIWFCQHIYTVKSLMKTDMIDSFHRKKPTFKQVTCIY